MFDFFKRKEDKEKPAKRAEPQKSPVEPATPSAETVEAVSPHSSPAKPQPLPSDVEAFQVRQTMRVPGLGEFHIHDIKGGKGKSGMGIVYIALDAVTVTPYAVKTFQRWCLETPELIQRFLREVETWIKLDQHQNIVRAYYVAVLNDQPYVFLEYVAGSDLRKKLAAGPIPVPNALRYAIQFCRGMAHAQKKVPGLVHRDVKPENCLFTPDDVLKVTDFGLVKVLSGARISPGGAPATEQGAEFQSQFFQTQVGEMGVGTMPYMAPEQFTDFAQVGVPADIYSLGIMLYEMLTGRRPFRIQGREPDQWYLQHSNVIPTDPNFLKPEIGLRLSQLVMRCMAKKPEQRYQNFAHLEMDLSTILKEQYQVEIPKPAAQELEAWEVLNKGAALSNLGREKEAIACFEKALEILPRFDAAWLNKGVVLAKAKRYQEAIQCYDKAVEINPNSAHAWYNRGYALQQQESLEEALRCYDRALELDPLYDSAWLNKGVILRKLLRAREAVECYNKVLTLNPQSAVAWFNRGFAWRQLGRTQEELECYERAVAISPQFTEAWLNRGVVLRKLNRLIEALACYDRVLQLHPKHPDAWYNKGIVLGKLGQKVEADRAFQKAAALSPRLAEQLKRQRLQ